MSELKPCPFCDGQPVFNGDGKNWQDENRFVLMELECCVSMRASVGWAKARDMTPAAIETVLKSKLTEAWNRRVQPAQAEAVPSDVVRDAERYRWLRSKSHYEYTRAWIGGHSTKKNSDVDFLSLDEALGAIDASIDAAIAQQKGGV